MFRVALLKSARSFGINVNADGSYFAIHYIFERDK